MKYYLNQITTDEVSGLEAYNKEVSFKAALEGIVLLKNDNEVLPIKNKKIALYGVGAKYTIKGGTGSGEVNERHVTSIYEGLVNEGFEITSNDYLDEYSNLYEQERIKWKKSNTGLYNLVDSLSSFFYPPCGRKITLDDVIKSDTDTAIYVVSRQAGEGKDKKLALGEFDLNEFEINTVKFLKENYKKVILVINSGSYLDIKDLDRYADAIIFYCQQGMEGGRALATLISGKESFSGKLTDCWAKSYDDVIYGNEYSYNNNDTFNEYYKEGIYVGYRYYDTFKIEPRYHFGFGLTYSTFAIKTKQIIKDKDKFTLKVEVTNTGKYKGKEVVQLYCSCPKGNLAKEYQRLVGFSKTNTLLPGEKQTLEISFDAYNMASYCPKCSSYILEKGNYIIRIGNSSNNTYVSKVIKVDELLIISKHDSIIPIDKNFDELVNNNVFDNDILEDIEVIHLLKEDITTINYKYEDQSLSNDSKVNEIVDKLSIKELVDVCVGEGTASMFSYSKICTPGAVGRTTSKLFKKGLINVNLSDGPAGLRLLKESGITKRGKLRFVKGHYLFSFMELLPSWLLNLVSYRKKDTKLYQFTTSFPVETAIAQSFNEEIAYEIGRAISEEMSVYNVTYWLAPALNIHKNPLCGRNFEYMSEDPLLTGKIASGLIKGVSSIKGNYVTIKHFACNNVEDNRNMSNSHVLERTLREIYLKPFEIAIKEGKADSVMTSYNKLNGNYTSTIYDLNTKALRNEWGFDGVVMTDWYSTTKKYGRADLSLLSGNDLIMPGSNYCKKEILKAVKKGTLSVTKLKICASNIIKQIINSNVATKINIKDFK